MHCKNKSNFYEKELYSQSKYFHQIQFDIIFCGDYHLLEKGMSSCALRIDINSLNNEKILPKMNVGLQRFIMVCVKCDIYTFGGFNCKNKHIMSIQKYSPVTNTWDMQDFREDFTACSFIDDVYLIGDKVDVITNSCVRFNTRDRKWSKVAGMRQSRILAASVMYKEKIVVSGGNTNTVESFDRHVCQAWYEGECATNH